MLDSRDCRRHCRALGLATSGCRAPAWATLYCRALALAALCCWSATALAAEKKAVPLDQPAPPSMPAPPQPSKYDLEYKFEPGEILRWQVVHRAAIDTTIQGTNQTAETRSTSVKAWKVSDASASGQITFVHSVESIDMWQKSQGRQEVRYNSLQDDKIPPEYEEVAKAVNVPLTVVTIDRRGKVIKREEKQLHAVANNAPITIPLPTEPVAVGYSWSVPVEMDVLLHGGASKKISTRQLFTLEKVVDGLATIEVDMQILSPINDPAIEAQLVQRLTKGWLKFDIERGRVISQQLDMDRHVIGFSGAASSMHYLTRYTEELLKDTADVAQRPKTPRATRTPPAVIANPFVPVDRPVRK